MPNSVPRIVGDMLVVDFNGASFAARRSDVETYADLGGDSPAERVIGATLCCQAFALAQMMPLSRA